ncbi:hypothetical protein BLNAU_5515 [Blattamonas nauphoetae]|uniref:Right handed beta helix domain-containing protein n=1 Tax=Blattamonas nauphoetae TaxID=2049346 RepID=A0ABQ9Y6W1_9EUKA|nr:hypothetical protein BLNAU_5515 [Blattamonas nauphoetae]
MDSLGVLPLLKQQENGTQVYQPWWERIIPTLDEQQQNGHMSFRPAHGYRVCMGEKKQEVLQFFSIEILEKFVDDLEELISLERRAIAHSPPPKLYQTPHLTGTLRSFIRNNDPFAIEITLKAGENCSDTEGTDAKCPTINKAVSHYLSDKQNLALQIKEGTYTESNIAINDLELSAHPMVWSEPEASDPIKPSVTLIHEGEDFALFMVTTGVLKLTGIGITRIEQSLFFLQMTSTGKIEINFCDFDGNDEWGPNGCILLDETCSQSIDSFGTLKITSTTFHDLHRNLKKDFGGGAALCALGGKYTISHSVFASCMVNAYGGAIHAHMEHGSSIHNCTFVNCIAYDSMDGYYHAGALHLYTLAIGPRLSITDCLFKSNSAKDPMKPQHEGSDIRIWGSLDDVEITNCFSTSPETRFILKSEAHFGILNDLIDDPSTADNVFISDAGSDDAPCLTDSPCLSFSKAQKAGNYVGYVLNIRTKTTWTVDNEVTKPVTIKSEDSNRATLNLKNETAANVTTLEGYFRVSAETRLDTIDLVLYQYSTAMSFVSLTAATTLTISNVEIKTNRTGSQGHTHQTAFFVGNGQIVIESISFSSNPDFDPYAPIWLAGGSLIDESENKVTMTVVYRGDRGWIGLEGNTTTDIPNYPNLKLKKWSFGGNSTAKQSHGLYLTNFGTVELTSCSFSSFKKGWEEIILDGSAIHAVLCSSSILSITSCSFTSCSSEGNGGSVSATLAGGSFTITDSTFSSTASGNGGGLHVVVSDTAKASIAGNSFTSCSSSIGGGLFLDISQSTKPDKKDSFSITKGTSGLSFTGCTATTGSWMYFVMTDRAYDYDRVTLQSAFEESPPLGVSIGYEELEEFDLFEIVDYSGLYLSDSGSDVNTCKTIPKPCKSLSTVLSKTLPPEKIIFVIGWGSQNGSTVLITKDFHLKSNTESYSVFHLDGQGKALTQTDPLLHIESHVEATLIDFRIKQKSWECAFIHVLSEGSLTFHSVILSHTPSFGTGDHFDSFVHAMGGTVTIKVLDILKLIDFNSNPPFWLSENSSLIKTSDYPTEIQVYCRSKESFDGGIIGTEASDTDGATLDLRYITFIGPYSEGSGEDKGAILLNQVKSANIEECIFKDFVSTVNREETVIKITPNGRDSDVTIKNCQFRNTKRKNSGAIWLTNDQEGASLTIQGSELTPIPFTSCQSEDAGGSIQLAVRGTTVIQFCAFSASKTTTADKSGGAVSATKHIAQSNTRKENTTRTDIHVTHARRKPKPGRERHTQAIDRKRRHFLHNRRILESYNPNFELWQSLNDNVDKGARAAEENRRHIETEVLDELAVDAVDTSVTYEQQLRESSLRDVVRKMKPFLKQSSILIPTLPKSDALVNHQSGEDTPAEECNHNEADHSDRSRSSCRRWKTGRETDQRLTRKAEAELANAEIAQRGSQVSGTCE